MSTMCQGLSHFSGFLHDFALAKLGLIEFLYKLPSGPVILLIITLECRMILQNI